MNLPTLNECVNAFLNAFTEQFGTLTSKLKSVWRGLALALGGQLRLLYLFGAKVQKNTFPDLADTEADGGTLERWGRGFLNRNPFNATQGEYVLTVSGEAGAEISPRVIFKNDNGYSFQNKSLFTFTGDTGQITVRALTSGADALLAVGEELSATEPILNVAQSATVDSITISPQDSEPIEEYRAKIMQNFRLESQGGASGDYRLWAADAQGVLQVYPFLADPLEINLFVEATDADSVPEGSGIPTQTILDAVEAVVNQDPDTTKSLYQRARLPMGVIVHYLPIVNIDVVVTINNYTGDKVADKAIIESAIIDYLKTIRPYVAAADKDDKSFLYDVKLISVINAAIGTESFTGIVLNVDGADVANYHFLNGDIPKLTTLNIP